MWQYIPRPSEPYGDEEFLVLPLLRPLKSHRRNRCQLSVLEDSTSGFVDGGLDVGNFVNIAPFTVVWVLRLMVYVFMLSCVPGTWYAPLSTSLSRFITFLAYRSECDYDRRTTVSATDTSFVFISSVVPEFRRCARRQPARPGQENWPRPFQRSTSLVR